MKTLSLYASAASLTLTLASADILHFTASLDGLQETPPVATPGSGFADIWYNTATDTLDYSVTFSDLIAGLTAAHFHLAPVGTPGGVVLGLTGAPIGSTSGSWSGDDVEAPVGFLDNLQDDLIYVNLHTSFRPGGEIRGQFFEEISNGNGAPVPEPGTWIGAAAVAGLVCAARRRSK